MPILFIDIYFSLETFIGIMIAIVLYNALMFIGIGQMLKKNHDRELSYSLHHHEINLQLKNNLIEELEHRLNKQATELQYKDLQLEKSRQRLLRQSREIDQINSMIELKDWKLQNSVKEALQEGL